MVGLIVHYKKGWHSLVGSRAFCSRSDPAVPTRKDTMITALQDTAREIRLRPIPWPDARIDRAYHGAKGG